MLFATKTRRARRKHFLPRRHEDTKNNFCHENTKTRKHENTKTRKKTFCHEGTKTRRKLLHKTRGRIGHGRDVVARVLKMTRSATLKDTPERYGARASRVGVGPHAIKRSW